MLLGSETINLGSQFDSSPLTSRFALVLSRRERREAGMKYVDYMAMSPEDRMVFYRNLDNKTDREKILFLRAQAELMLGRVWRRQKHRIVAALREYDAQYGITEDDLK
jgi:hypothetical protein